MKNTALLRCNANQVGTGHKLHFRPKNWVRAKLAGINFKKGCGTDEVWYIKLDSVSYHWYYHIRSGKRHIFSVVPPTKPAQTISSIFSPKIQLWPNWQQSTTKMAVARLRGDADIFVVDCCQFVPCWIFGLLMEFMVCAGLVGGTKEQSRLFADNTWYYIWYEELPSCLHHT